MWGGREKQFNSTKMLKLALLSDAILEKLGNFLHCLGLVETLTRHTV